MKLKKQTLILLSATAIAFSSMSRAQTGNDTNTTTPYYKKWEFSLYAGTLAFNPESALQEGVESKATVIGMSADYDHGKLLTSMGVDIVLYDDEASFTTRTEDQYGNTQNSSSSASGGLLYIATGPKWRLGKSKKTTLFAQGGLSLMTGSDRSVANCSNCPSSSIDIKGGAYTKLGVLQNIGSSAFGINYVNYFGSDDIESGFNLVWSSSY